MKDRTVSVPAPQQRDRCLRIEVTTRCNNRCRHCFARADTDEFSDLPVSLVEDFIDEGRGCGYDQLHLTGGEPFLWPGLFKALTHAVQAGYGSIFMNTNGSLLTGKLIQQLAAYDTLAISVSLDGPQRYHDRIRGDFSFEKAIAGIQAALDASIDVSIFTIVRKSLLPHLPRFAGNIFQGCPSIQRLTLIQLIRAAGDAQGLDSEFLRPDEFLQTVKTAAWLNRYGCRVDFLNNPLSALSAKLMGLWIPGSRPLFRDGSLCLLANGKLTLAHSRRDPVGTYVPGNLSRILSARKYANAVAPDSHYCPECRFAGLCLANDMVRPTEGSGTPATDKPFCQDVLELIGSESKALRQISLD